MDQWTRPAPTNTNGRQTLAQADIGFAHNAADEDVQNGGEPTISMPPFCSALAPDHVNLDNGRGCHRGGRHLPPHRDFASSSVRRSTSCRGARYRPEQLSH
jgi:hypothetical protein